MPDELETVLRWVADGRLTPDEAAPIVEALSRAAREGGTSTPDDTPGEDVDPIAISPGRLGRRLDQASARMAEAREAGGGRRLRIRVTERGRQVVNLRIPIGFVETALRFVPGLGGEQEERIREAVRAGAVGPILDVEDADGEGGVLISVE